MYQDSLKTVVDSPNPMALIVGLTNAEEHVPAHLPGNHILSRDIPKCRPSNIVAFAQGNLLVVAGKELAKEHA